MVDEQKQECKCECYKIAAKFLLLTTSVFVGTLLAIIFAAHLLKPPFPPPCNCNKGMHKMPPRMERQLPPGPMMHHQRMPQDFRKGEFPQRQMKFEGKRIEFQGPRPDFQKVPPTNQK